jgi:hypothetical protein
MGYDVTADEHYSKAYGKSGVSKLLHLWNVELTVQYNRKAGAKCSKDAIITHAALLALPTNFFPPHDFQTVLKHRKVTHHCAALFLNSKIEAEKDIFSIMRMSSISGFGIEHNSIG